MSPLDFLVIKIGLLTTISFLLALCFVPLWYKVLIKFKLGKQIREGNTPIFTELHAKKAGTPTMGGVVVWLTVLVLTIGVYYLSKVHGIGLWSKLNFLTRPQTLLPLGALIASAIVGAVDDVFNVKKIGPWGGGLSMKMRLLIYTLIAIVGAWWFYYKLSWDVLHIPFWGDVVIGWSYKHG